MGWPQSEIGLKITKALLLDGLSLLDIKSSLLGITP